MFYPAFSEYMVDYLSESDKSRIAEFIATPKYEREPEMLLPDPDGEVSNGEK